ncbi:winged helix-turn-helix domain-containing protein [Paenibacillus sp. CAU 1782]
MFLEWNANQYEIAAQGIVIRLLAKEYALLTFLYRNRGQSFSREQLLDKVWPLEYPTERTVDDHIYRLRKKLIPLRELKLETVRGIGYKLSVDESGGGFHTPPSATDKQLQDTMQGVFARYHRYGQGKSMLALARQQDVLGYELNGFYHLYIYFLQGDLERLLDETTAPLPDRLYWLLLLYAMAGFSADKVSICEEVLDKKLLNPPQHRELRLLNILNVYTYSGQTDKTFARLKETRKALEEPEMDNFKLAVYTSELLACMVIKAREEELDQLSGEIERLLAEKPFYREKGTYLVVNGLRLLCQGKMAAGEDLMDEGLHVLETSGFVPIKLSALNIIVHFPREDVFSPHMYKKYSELLSEELSACGLPALGPRLESVIRSALHSV